MSNETRYVHKAGANSQALVAFLQGLGTPQLLAVYNSVQSKPTKSFKDKATAVERVRKMAEAEAEGGKVYWIDAGEQPAFHKGTPPADDDGIPPELRVTPEEQKRRDEARAKLPPAPPSRPPMVIPPSQKVTAEGTKRAPKTEDTQVIRMIAKENPKREGTKAAERFGKMRDGMTVAAFIVAVASVAGKLDKKLARRARRLVTKSVARGHVKLEAPTRG